MADLIPAHELRAHARRTISVQSCLKVYDTLLDRRGDNLTAWPSVGSLSESTGATTRTVRLALRALERTGWIVQVETERATHEYSLHVGSALGALRDPVETPAEQPIPTGEEPQFRGNHSSGGEELEFRGGGTPVPGGGGTGVPPNYSSERSNEGSKELSKDAHEGDAREANPSEVAPNQTAKVEPSPPSQPELLTAPVVAGEPKRSKGRGQPKPTPEQDPTWTAFVALAVEHGRCDGPLSPDAQHNTTTRGKAFATLVAEHGADEVLAVWRHTLTSPRRDPDWYRTSRQGIALIGTFLRPGNFQRLADDLEAVRDIERKAQRPRLALVPKAVEATDPVAAFRAVCAALGDEVATPAKVAALVPDPTLRFDVEALANALHADIRVGFTQGGGWTDEALRRQLPDARLRWQAALDRKAADRAEPRRVAQ